MSNTTNERLLKSYIHRQQKLYANIPSMLADPFSIYSCIVPSTLFLTGEQLRKGRQITIQSVQTKISIDITQNADYETLDESFYEIHPYNVEITAMIVRQQKNFTPLSASDIWVPAQFEETPFITNSERQINQFKNPNNEGNITFLDTKLYHFPISPVYNVKGAGGEILQHTQMTKFDTITLPIRNARQTYRTNGTPDWRIDYWVKIDEEISSAEVESTASITISMSTQVLFWDF